MARKREVFTLAASARSSLKSLLSKGEMSVRKLRRVQILLNLDRGEHYETIAQTVGVSVPTIYNVRNRCKAEGIFKGLHRSGRRKD